MPSPARMRYTQTTLDIGYVLRYMELEQFGMSNVLLRIYMKSYIFDFVRDDDVESLGVCCVGKQIQQNMKISIYSLFECVLCVCHIRRLTIGLNIITGEHRRHHLIDDKFFSLVSQQQHSYSFSSNCSLCNFSFQTQQWTLNENSTLRQGRYISRQAEDLKK